jgi:hypothetical protein
MRESTQKDEKSIMRKKVVVKYFKTIKYTKHFNSSSTIETLILGYKLNPSKT